jgi:hypothetical protein
LVAKAAEWPGINCVRAILEDEPLKGLWFDRTQEYAARNRGETFDRLKYATVEVLELSPLPCWAHLSPEKYRQRVAALVDDIEREAAAELKKRGLQPLGVKAVLKQHPHTRPNRAKKITSAEISCGYQAGSAGALADVCCLRGGIPRSGRETKSRRSQGKLSSGLVPARPALCKSVCQRSAVSETRAHDPTSTDLVAFANEGEGMVCLARGEEGAGWAFCLPSDRENPPSSLH